MTQCRYARRRRKCGNCSFEPSLWVACCYRTAARCLILIQLGLIRDSHSGNLRLRYACCKSAGDKGQLSVDIAHPSSSTSRHGRSPLAPYARICPLYLVGGVPGVHDGERAASLGNTSSQLKAVTGVSRTGYSSSRCFCTSGDTSMPGYLHMANNIAQTQALVNLETQCGSNA